MKRNYFGRFLITAIGLLFILMSIILSMLGILGEKSTGLITDVRREMGERTDTKPGRYTYSIGYSFELPDGKTIYGSSKKISDGVYLKNPNTTINIRYLKIFPYINAIEQDIKFDMGKLIMIAAGGLLVFVANKKQ